ncbi:MAG TPA: hypothetical protein VKV28_07115 [Candidatus Binataceae bacterium]|nr:hypothetical protein [Candidatus Binataceae bacterium]
MGGGSQLGQNIFEVGFGQRGTNQIGLRQHLRGRGVGDHGHSHP